MNVWNFLFVYAFVIYMLVVAFFQPPSTLELFLRNPSNVTWIFQLYQKAASEGRSQEWEEEEFGTIIRQIVIQLCSLSSFLKGRRRNSCEKNLESH